MAKERPERPALRVLAGGACAHERVRRTPTFDQLLENREEFIKQVEFPKGQATWNRLGGLIRSTLIKEGAVLPLTEASQREFAHLQKKLCMSAWGNCTRRNLDMRRHEEYGKAAIKPFTKYVANALKPKKFVAVHALLWHLLDRVFVPDIYTARMAVYLMNENRLVPRVIAIPNLAAPENPFYVATDDEPTVPAASLARFIRLFDY